MDQGAAPIQMTAGNPRAPNCEVSPFSPVTSWLEAAFTKRIRNKVKPVVPEMGSWRGISARGAAGDGERIRGDVLVRAPSLHALCLRVITPGWKITLRAGGEAHVLRTDEEGDNERMEQ